MNLEWNTQQATWGRTIAGAKSGNPKPAKDRQHTMAAMADAAYNLKASTVYVWILRKVRMIPAPSNKRP